MSDSTYSEIARKQLLKYPKTGNMLKMHYYESVVLKQIHMDTLFWDAIESGDEALIPILAIVDTATRYTKYYVQQAKNDRVREFLQDFIDEAESTFPDDEIATNITLYTDGAKELIVKGVISNKTITHKVSPNINKAVLAEVAIRKLRGYLRKIEARLETDYLVGDQPLKILNRESLSKFIPLLETHMNSNAKVYPEPSNEQRMSQQFNLGDPVLIVNLHKFAPRQIGTHPLKKTSYERAYYTEPFYISKVIFFQGLYKYQVRSYTNNEAVKYNFYTEQLQLINPKIAQKYITNYIAHYASINEDLSD